MNVRVVEIQLDDNRTVTIPWANVELLDDRLSAWEWAKGGEMKKIIQIDGNDNIAFLSSPLVLYRGSYPLQVI